MTPANDNDDRARHAGIVLRHVFGKEGRQAGSKAHARLLAGLEYARADDPADMDATLSIARVEALARRILREGADLTEAGKALGPYKTAATARAWATKALECALDLLAWHPRRIAFEKHMQRLTDRCTKLEAQNASLISRQVS